MPDARNKLIEEIFHAAADLPSTERPNFLAERCASDPSLREAVQELLGHLDQAAADFMRTSALSRVMSVAEIRPDSVLDGKYKALHVIGEGGLGVVWLAEQLRPVRRKVALKIVKLGLDTRQLLARFDAERQALAMMDHPFIAHVYDAGVTEQGRPFFVMEYIQGVAISEFCDQRQLTMNQRLELFIQVCEGVHHAHQRGVIHRDLKPSNILVTECEGRPLPKIIDFGIAKATTATLTERTICTEHGQLIGTPEYMSPEQAEMDHRGVDSTTDIYSLGVILYQLVAGVLPFELKSDQHVSMADVQRTVRERDPKRPSTRLSTLGRKQVDIAAHRQTDTRSLRRALRGDLDWITLKAIERHRERRYASASELAADLRRHLNNEPVLAGPPTLVYRTGKFVRRNRALVGGSVAALLTLILGLAVAIWFAVGEAKQRTIADARTTEARWSAYRSGIGAASAFLGSGNAAAAQRSLRETPSELRNWEWNYLNWISDRSLLTIRANAQFDASFAVSRDDHCLATASKDGKTHIWNLVDGQLIQTLEVSGPVSFSPDGACLLGMNPNNDLCLFNIHNGEANWRIRGLSRISVEAFSPDGDEFAAGGGDPPALSILAAKDGRIRRASVAQRASVQPLGYSRDGSTVCAIIDDTDVAGFDAETLQIRWRRPMANCTMNHTRDYIVIATSNRPQRVLVDARTGNEIGPIYGVDVRLIGDDSQNAENDQHEQHHFESLAYSGASLMVYGQDSQAVRIRLEGHLAAVSNCRYSHDGEQIISASNDGVIKTWDAQIHDSVWKLSSTMSHSADVDSHGRFAATGGWGYLTLYDGSTGMLRWGRSVSSDYLDHLAFNDEGSRIAVAGRKGRILLVETADGAANAVPDFDEVVTSIKWAGKDLVAGLSTGEVIVLTANGERLLKLKGHASAVRSLAVARDMKGVSDDQRPPSVSAGCLIATGSGNRALHRGEGVPLTRAQDNSVRLWNRQTGELVRKWTVEDGVSALAFSPDASLLFVGLVDGRAEMFQVRDGATQWFQQADADVTAARFSSDGARIAMIVGNVFGTTHLLDARRGEDLLLLPLQGNAMFMNEFCLMTSGYDTGVALAETAPPQSINETYSARSRIANAMSVVYALSRSFSLNEDVAAQLRQSNAPAEIRSTALEIVGRCQPDANRLNSEAWGTVRYNSDTSKHYREALRKSEAASSIWPHEWSYLNTLAAAQYRVGEFADALGTAEQCDALRRQRAGDSHPVDLCIMAMSRHHLHEDAHAQRDLIRARALMNSPMYANEAECRSFVEEAVSVIHSSVPQE